MLRDIDVLRELPQHVTGDSGLEGWKGNAHAGNKARAMLSIKVYLSGVSEPVVLTDKAAESFMQLVWNPQPGRPSASELPHGRLFGDRFFMVPSGEMQYVFNIDTIVYVEKHEA